MRLEAGQSNAACRPPRLTSQLLSAQAKVPSAQNALLTVWISYLNTRLQLYRDLEIMPLDGRGVWPDDEPTLDCNNPCYRPGLPVFTIPPAKPRKGARARTGPSSPNGSPHPGPSTHPVKPRRSSRLKLLLVGCALAALAVAGVAAYSLTSGPKGPRSDLILHKVRYEPLNLTVVEPR